MKKLSQITTAVTILLTILFFVSIYRYFLPGYKFSENSTTVNNLPENNGETDEQSEEDLTIGWSVYNASFEFFQAMQQGVLDKAAELNMKVIPHDQKSQTSEMISGALELINQGVDALVISPINPNAMIIIANMTKDAGIPLIIVDIGTGGVDYDAFIVSDSYGGGVLAGEYAINLITNRDLPSKNFAVIKTEETALFANRRGDAFKRVLTDAGYNLVAEVIANSDEIEAYNAMKSILPQYQDDLAIVFAENDRMALGAARAIDEAGKKGEILIIGFDGDPAAIEAIQNGDMQGTIAQKPYEMGSLGAEMAYKILNGEYIAYDDRNAKELLVEVFLIDENGDIRSTSP